MTNTIYGVDSKDIKYIAFNSEIIPEELVIRKTQTKTLKIKFNKQLNGDEDIKTIYFDDVILDYDSYKELKNKSLYTQRTKIKINI